MPNPDGHLGSKSDVVDVPHGLRRLGREHRDGSNIGLVADSLCRRRAALVSKCIIRSSVRHSQNLGSCVVYCAGCQQEETIAGEIDIPVSREVLPGTTLVVVWVTVYVV